MPNLINSPFHKAKVLQQAKALQRMQYAVERHPSCFDEPDSAPQIKDLHSKIYTMHLIARKLVGPLNKPIDEG